MNTKQIVIECWFIESEDFIKENVGSLDINYKLIKDWGITNSEFEYKCINCNTYFGRRASDEGM